MDLTKAPKRRVSWLAIGDWGEQGALLDELARDMARYVESWRPVDMVLALGDNFYPRGVTSLKNSPNETGPTAPFAADMDAAEFYYWRKAFLRHKALQVPWRVVLGNHDYMGGLAEAQLRYTYSTANKGGFWNFPSRCYSFREGPVFFIGFDGCAAQWAVRRVRPSIMAEFEADKEWLRRELASNQDAPFIVLYLHHPFYTDGIGHHSEALCLRSKRYNGRDGLDLESVLLEHRVDLIMAGHEHVMQAKKTASGLHVSCGATVECNYYGGERTESEMDWKLSDGTRGFVACEADVGDKVATLAVRFVRIEDLTVVKEYVVNKPLPLQPPIATSV